MSFLDEISFLNFSKVWNGGGVACISYSVKLLNGGGMACVAGGGVVLIPLLFGKVPFWARMSFLDFSEVLNGGGATCAACGVSLLDDSSVTLIFL